jgi:hypothetical protein
VDKVTIRLRDIELTQLNNESLRLLAAYVRLVRSKKGMAFKMQDKDILVQVSNYTRKSKDPELKELYTRLKLEVLESVHQSIINQDNH